MFGKEFHFMLFRHTMSAFTVITSIWYGSIENVCFFNFRLDLAAYKDVVYI